MNDMSYNSYRCKFGSNYILWNSVTVARQTLTLFVGVRIPIPLPKRKQQISKEICCFLFYFRFKKRVFAVEKMDKMNNFSRFCKSLTKPTNHATLHIKNKRHECSFTEREWYNQTYKFRLGR